MRAIITTVMLALVCSCGGEGTTDDRRICSAECERYATCYAEDLDLCTDGCTELLEELLATNRGCHQAQVELKSCVSGLTCEQLDEYWDANPASSYPCRTEYDETTYRCY